MGDEMNEAVILSNGEYVYLDFSGGGTTTLGKTIEDTKQKLKEMGKEYLLGKLP